MPLLTQTLSATLAGAASLVLLASAAAQEAKATSTPVTLDDLRMVAPALERYSRERLLDDVWKRPGLGPRDRSIVTLAALIARNQGIELRSQLGLALDNGVKPREISKLVTHLAFYSGWANAMSAVAADLRRHVRGCARELRRCCRSRSGAPAWARARGRGLCSRRSVSGG